MHGICVLWIKWSIIHEKVKNYETEGKWRKLGWDSHRVLKISLLPPKSEMYIRRWGLKRKIEKQSYYSGIVRETLLLHTLGDQRIKGKMREPRDKEEESSHE